MKTGICAMVVFIGFVMVNCQDCDHGDTDACSDLTCDSDWKVGCDHAASLCTCFEPHPHPSCEQTSCHDSDDCDGCKCAHGSDARCYHISHRCHCSNFHFIGK